MRRQRWKVVLGIVLAVVLLPLGASGVDASSGQTGPPEASDWTQISSGYYHTCGVRSTGRLYCWGQGTRGQLGNNNVFNTSTPVEVAGGATNWKSVSAGSGWTCAVKTTGTLWCWGRDDFGQLGNGPGTTGDLPLPTQVGSATDWKSVSAGLGETTCGRRANKRIYCWGRDNNGQVGNGPGSFGNVDTPTAVGTNADWTMVSTGGYHTCGRRSSGRLYCWGDDQDGAVGDGGGLPGTDRSVPTQVAGARTDWTSVASGITHACARRSSGRLYCWGSDIFGGIGNGPPNDNSAVSSPVQVAGAATDWKAVYAGSYVTCATKVNGRLYCWGDDVEGQNGAGSLAGSGRRSSPAQVAGGATDWKSATIGNLHVCGRRATNRIYCWGDGFFGQRGDGLSGQPGNTPQPNPTEVS